MSRLFLIIAWILVAVSTFLLIYFQEGYLRLFLVSPIVVIPIIVIDWFFFKKKLLRYFLILVLLFIYIGIAIESLRSPVFVFLLPNGVDSVTLKFERRNQPRLDWKNGSNFAAINVPVHGLIETSSKFPSGKYGVDFLDETTREQVDTLITNYKTDRNNKTITFKISWNK